MIAAQDLLRASGTDPTSIYRYRDGLYAADLLTAALGHLDFFTWLNAHPADKDTICRSLALREHPVDVMLTLFIATDLIRKEGATFVLTEMGKEHLVSSSPWCIGPYFASVKDRPVCLDMVLRTGKPARWASLRSEQEWAKAMESPAFASQFTAAMDCRGVYLAPAVAQRLDCAAYHHLLDGAGGSGIYACAIVARHPHLRATVLEKQPVDRLAAQAIAECGFNGRVSVAKGDMFRDPLPTDCDIHLFSNVLHDWNAPTVQELLAKSFASLVAGGMIVVHDAHTNESAFRALDPLPRCRFCTAVARPNILMFGDWSWLESRTREQQNRLNLWVEGIQNSNTRFVVVEAGAGTAIPTVRLTSERLAGKLKGTLIRLNSREATVPHHAIALSLSALEGIQRLYAAL